MPSRRISLTGGAGAMDGARRAIEGSEIAIACALHDAAPEAVDFRLHHRVVTIKQVPPAAVSHFRRALR